MKTAVTIFRQKLLKRALPAVVVLVVYFAFIGPKFSAARAKAEAEVQRQKDAYLVGQTKINELTLQKKMLLAELADLHSKVDQQEADPATQAGSLGQSGYGSQAIERLNAALTRNRLRVLEDGRQDWRSAKDSIPKSVSELVEPAKGKSNDADASFWRVRFSGSYPNVYRALDEIQRGGDPIIPISLDMTTPEGEGDIEWTIRAWN